LGWSHAVGWSGTPGLIGGAVRMNAGTRLGELKDAFARAYIIHNSNKVIFEKKDILFNYRSSSFPNNSIITKIDLIYDYEYLKPVAELLNQAHEYRLKRRASQPSTASLGSFFTNPYPHFAAQLIESCNMKGYSYKSAQISPLHANFIINNGHASAADILSLAHAAQKAVREKFGVILKPEVKFVGIFETNLLS
jgi:UDP-N-acetylmuramate dehydrogenase